MQKQKMLAAYCRVSTSDGRQTTETQLHAVKQYVAAHSDWKLAEVYKDEASGGTFDREGLNALRKACESGKVDAVIVWRLDRLGRSVIELLQTLSWFGERNIGFVSIMENVDTTTSAGKLLVTFLAAIAEYERMLIKERTVAGIERAKANGIKLGRPRRGFDFAAAVAMRNQGMGYKQIADALKVSRTTVFRSLAAMPIPKSPSTTAPLKDHSKNALPN